VYLEEGKYEEQLKDILLMWELCRFNDSIGEMLISFTTPLSNLGIQ